MSVEFITKLPTPEEIRLQYPISDKMIKIKEERDEMIRKVFTGESDKFLVIIGPCSADNEDAVCEYVGRLAKIQEKVKDRLILIPRIYTNKPRTTGEGYKGLLHQPDPEKKPDVLAGLIAIRNVHMRAIEESGLTAADEMLYRRTGAIFRIFFVYSDWGAFCGESAAPYGSQRDGCACRHEESYQRGFERDA